MKSSSKSYMELLKKWTSFDKRWNNIILPCTCIQKMPPRWGYTKSFWSYSCIWASGMTFDWWSGIVLINWIRKKSWTNDGFTWSISIDLPKRKLLLIDKRHWHVWKQEWEVRMESYLLLSVMVVRSSTKPFMVSKTKESTFMCHSASFKWFKSM